MTTYIYPSRLPLAFIYPDVEPRFTEPMDGYEIAFKKLAPLDEIITQRLGDGAFPSDNLLLTTLGWNPFKGRSYNSKRLDEDIFNFKKEYDSLLAKAGTISFVVPQLSEILAKEIKSAVDNNFPSLNNEKVRQQLEQLTKQALVDTAADVERSESLQLGLVTTGVMTLTKGVEFAENVQLAAQGQGGVAFMMQTITPFIEMAVSILFNILYAIGSLIAAVYEGAAIALTASTIGSAIAQGATIGAAAAVPALALGFVLAVAMFAITIYMRDEEVKEKWNKYRNSLKKSLAKLKPVMAEMVERVNTELKDQRQSLLATMVSFRSLIGEMVAKNIQGEYVVGFMSCDCNGNMLLNYGASTDPEGLVPQKKGMDPDTRNAMLLVAAASLLAAGRR